jgi:hypothetical protein
VTVSAGPRPDDIVLDIDGEHPVARAHQHGDHMIAQHPAPMPPLMRAPSIAVGLGEKPMAMPELKLASLAMPGPELDPRDPARPEPLRPIINCDGETNRIKAYAQKASAGVAASPDEDLALFTPEGEPTPNLARVMENMSAVEIGPLRADKAVIAAGIARAMAAIRQAQAAKEQASR